MTRNKNLVDYTKLREIDRETFNNIVEEITCGDVCTSKSQSTCARTRWL